MHTYRHTQFYVHATLFYFVRTISVADRLLAVCLHFAVLTCTHICCATLYKVLLLSQVSCIDSGVHQDNK